MLSGGTVLYPVHIAVEAEPNRNSDGLTESTIRYIYLLSLNVWALFPYYFHNTTTRFQPSNTFLTTNANMPQSEKELFDEVLSKCIDQILYEFLV